MNKLLKYFLNPKRVIYRLAPNLLSDEDFIKIKFKDKVGYTPNLVHPRTFNEKLQYLKLHNKEPRYTILADKYLVREYVTKIIGSEYLIPLLGVWDNPNQIDFNQLPSQFVLKCNHDSGSTLICTDKAHFNIKDAKATLSKKLTHNYYYVGREWAYKNIKRKVIAEKYMKNITTKNENLHGGGGDL